MLLSTVFLSAMLTEGFRDSKSEITESIRLRTTRYIPKPCPKFYSRTDQSAETTLKFTCSSYDICHTTLLQPQLGKSFSSLKLFKNLLS